MIGLFEIGVNIIEQFMIILFLTMYFGRKHSGILKYLGFATGVIVAVGVITYLNNVYIYEGILGLIMIVVYFLYMLVFLKGDVYTKVFIAGCADCIVCMTSLMVMLLLSVVLRQGYIQFLEFSGARIALIVISKLLLIAVFSILLKYKIKSIANGKTKGVYYVLMMLPITIDLSINEIFKVFYEHAEFNLEMIIIAASVMTTIITAYCIFIKITYSEQLLADYNLLRQKYESDKQHTQELKELYAKICGIRHDLSIFFETAISYMSSDPNKAKEYMKSIINTQIEDAKNFIKSDNECFNAVTNAKISICEKYGIYVKISIMNNSLNKLSDGEIGIIFGNLFDNAIRAAKQTIEKAIELEVKISGDYLSIVMLNSIEKSVLQNNRNLETTKYNKNLHGIGTKNIKRIVSEYDGIINYFEEDGYFGCQILI